MRGQYLLEPMSPGQLGDGYRMQLAPQGIRWIWRPQFPPSWGRFPFEDGKGQGRFRGARYVVELLPFKS